MASTMQESTGAVNPALAQGAQIPLQTFQLPTFPPEAQGLRALTLTCDIKTDEYTELLKVPLAAIPALPRSITSLTLELFSMGYPPGFLTALAKELPNVKELVVYSQLLGGITPESEADAIQGFREWKELRSLHLLDVFGKASLFQKLGEELSPREKGLLFLEINYTFRHEDEEFLTRIPATEIPLLASPGLITCALNIAVPEQTDDPEDPSNLTQDGDQSDVGKNGVMAFNKTLAPEMVNAFAGEKRPKELRMLNSTLYTVDIAQLKAILEKQKRLALLNATVYCEPNEEWKAKLLEALSLCPDLEQVEIVGNPSLEFAMLMSNKKRQAETIPKIFPSESDMRKLAQACPKLSSLTANVLRTTSVGSASWKKTEDAWEGGIQKPEAKEESSGTTAVAEQQVLASA